MCSLKIEIVAIGNEVMSGVTTNTNAAEIGRALLEIGLIATRQTVLPDKSELLKEGLREALQRSDIVITTGGLGPTCDDITRQAAAELFHSDFIFRPEIAAELEKRYGAALPTIKDQATVPIKAEVLSNPLGTAPGFIFEEQGKIFILMPGVPPEMRAMLANYTIPFLDKRISPRERFYRKTAHLLNLPEAAVDPYLREIGSKYPQVDMGIYPSLGTLTVHMTVHAESKRAAENLLQAPYQLLREKFANHLYEAPSGKIDEAVHMRLIELKQTLSIAESCTGGAVSARLTRHSGASNYFLGGFVTYSNAMKEKVLNVPKSLIEAHGAVSAEVVNAMLDGVLALTGSDYAMAVTGIAGPSGGTPTKPVGTVWCGVARQGQKTHIWLLNARGSREMVIERSINAVLCNLYLMLKDSS